MYSSKRLLASALTWLLATTQAADLSYNGLAITPQMGWVSQVLCLQPQACLLIKSIPGQLERLYLRRERGSPSQHRAEDCRLGPSRSRIQLHHPR
jgi:hypothetical protein